MFFPAKAGIVQPQHVNLRPAASRLTSTFGASGKTKDQSLIRIIQDLNLEDNLKLCVDAGDINSFTLDTPGLFQDLSPHGNDLFLGTAEAAGSDDPTFNGTPGNLSKNEYFSFDGGDWFEWAAGNPAWVETLHKDQAQFTFFAVWTGLGQRLIQGYSNSPAETGMAWGFGQAYTIHADHHDSNFIYNTQNPQTSQRPRAGADGWNIGAVSLNEVSPTLGLNFFLNGHRTPLFDCVYASPDTGAADDVWGVCGNGTNTFFETDRRFACMAIWQGTVLTRGSVPKLYTHLRRRFKI